MKCESAKIAFEEDSKLDRLSKCDLLLFYQWALVFINYLIFPTIYFLQSLLNYSSPFSGQEFSLSSDLGAINQLQQQWNNSQQQQNGEGNNNNNSNGNNGGVGGLLGQAGMGHV